MDTETKEKRRRDRTIEHHLFQGMAAYQRSRAAGEWCEPRWVRFTRAGAFWDWLEPQLMPKTRCYLFAHNLGFDLPVLHAFTELPKRGWELARCVIETPPIILVWRKGLLNLTMLDTLNFWRSSLEELGDSIGLPKLKRPSLRASRARWDRYNKRDVEIIRKAVHSFWELLRLHDLGGFAPTLASQAVRAFRHRFMGHQVLIDDDLEALDLARRSLHGGRVECFRLGAIPGRVHCLDVNAMYPAVMRSQEYPTVLRYVGRQVTRRELVRWLKKYAVVADCLIETKRPRYAVVHEDRLVFPVGRLRVQLTTPELAEAIGRRELRRVVSVALYERAPLFVGFIDKLYAMRDQAKAAGDEVQSYMLKILTNSLYGKFAQRGFQWREHSHTTDLAVKVWSELDAETGELNHYRQLAGLVQERQREGESQDSHPAIASHVTAYARTLLWELLERAGRENVYYCDTDSLMVNDRGLERLGGALDPARLGALKYVCQTHTLRLYGPKDYRLGRQRVLKGIRAKAKHRGGATWLQEQWSTLVGLLNDGQADAPLVRSITKTMKRDYRKGEVQPSGLVLPLRLRQW